MSSSKNLEELLLSIIRRYPDGAPDDVVARESQLTSQERMPILNKLMNAKRIQLYEQGPTKGLVYKEITVEEAAKFKGLTTEDMLLYQIIKSAGNAGLWTKDMRVQSNLPQPHITKILRTLETRNLVKSVKNVTNPSRKVYMLAELEPSRDLTGGAWYTENQFDEEFIKVLREQCLGFIRRQGDTTLKDIAAFIKGRKFAKVDLREEDIMSIVQTLIYDGVVDSVEGDDPNDADEHFRPEVWPLPETTAFTDVPCGHCPVIGQCRDDGVISPATCEYYQKWLQF